MSAWILPLEHIRAMVNAGLATDEWWPLTWRTRPLTDAERELSCERGEPWGPEAMRVRAETTRSLTRASAEAVGAMLVAQNRASVDRRYDQQKTPDSYTHGHSRRRSALEILKAVSCYEHQSRETPDWEETEAWRFCQALKDNLVRELDGYADGPWLIED